MTSRDKILSADLASLRIIKYPDPRLAEVSTPIEEVGEYLRPLVDRMFELMFAAKGVGLAGPQVGITVRLFVASPKYDKADRRVYINPRLLSVDGSQDEEEGCLSVPGVNAKVKRYAVATIEATGLDGRIFQESGTELTARMYQHELDHLNGQLIVDRMGTVARLANRKTIKGLQEKYEEEQSAAKR
ncbi:MAG: peptide deformylase [Phycisphaerae bacterium]